MHRKLIKHEKLTIHQMFGTLTIKSVDFKPDNLAKNDKNCKWSI